MKRYLLVWIALCCAPNALASTPQQDVAWGQVEQSLLPALQGRQAAAEFAVGSRSAWLAGEASFETAYPHLAGAPLDQVASLRGRLRSLEDAAIQRSVQAQSAAPDLGESARVDVWRAKQTETHAAETQAEELEKQLLVGIVARLNAHPQLTAAALQPERERLRRLAGAGGSAESDARALQADNQLRLLNQTVGHILRAAVGPALVFDVESELAQVATNPSSLTRLQLLWPFLAPGSQAAVDGALATWWRAQPTPPYSDVEIEQIKDRLEREETPVAAWQIAREEMLQTWLQALVAERDGQAEQASPDVSNAEEAQESAERAVVEAEAAREDAEDAIAQRRADVNVGLARARKRVASVEERAIKQSQAADLISQQIDNEIALFQADVDSLEDRRRTVDADASYRRNRALSSQLRKNPAGWGAPLTRARDIALTVESSVAADTRRIEQAQGLVRSTSDVMIREQLRSQLEIWTDELEREQAAADALVEAAVRERDAVLRGLGEVRESRRALNPWISGAEREHDYSYLFEDVVQEFSLLIPSVWMRVRERGGDILSLPGHLTNFNVVRATVVMGAWLMLGLTIWGWARAQALGTAKIVCDRIRSVRPELRLSDMLVLHDPMARFFRAVVDLMLGYLLVSRLGAAIPEAGLVVHVYLQVVLYRALRAGFDLGVVPNDQVRPALMLLRRETWGLAKKSFSWVVGLLIARRFVVYLLWDVLGLDVITGLVSLGFTVALLVLTLSLLHLWQPFLQQRVQLRNQDSPVVSFLAKPAENDLAKAPRSLGILMFFMADTARNLMWALGRDRSGLAWMLQAINRYRDDPEEQKFTCIDTATTRLISGGPTDREYWFERAELGPEVAGALVAWREEHRRGLVAVVGDRGAGKQTACVQVADLLRDSGFEPTEDELLDHLVTEKQGLDWLSKVAGVPIASTTAELVASLDELPRRAFVLRGLHRAWSRRVEGFDAIKTLLYVLNATSDTHFWVISMHNASWAFFAASGS
ncbi:MAG: hypothetical protein GWP91_11725, partial [Rhodobacterales bacterium]|nr:hypothetical protein [Rhodobacterales bacterium]